MLRTKEIPKNIGDYLRHENGKLFWTKNVSRRIKIGDEAGTINKSTGYRVVIFKGQSYYTHRLLWFLTKNEQPPKEIDHINNDRLDNRIENLRGVTRNQNQHNTKTPKNNTSGIKGVGLHKPSNKWVARLTLNKKYIHIGCFTDKKEAEQAIKKAREEIHKDFANNG